MVRVCGLTPDGTRAIVSSSRISAFRLGDSSLTPAARASAYSPERKWLMATGLRWALTDELKFGEGLWDPSQHARPQRGEDGFGDADFEAADFAFEGGEGDLGKHTYSFLGSYVVV